MDIALSTSLPIALIFLPAADIPVFVGEGNCDLGITGLDQIKEAEMYDQINDLLDLQFGKCKLQLQVPADGEYNEPEQLVGKKIVSSFTSLATNYFENLESKSSGEKLDTSLRYVGGSVEASCALGVADGIVDLVESGETMRAAGLKAICTLLETSAHLISSKNPKFPETVDIIKQRFEGILAAQKYVLCNYNSPRSILKHVLTITPGRRSATVSALERKAEDDEDWVAVSVMIEKSQIGNKMDELKKSGASDILVSEISNCRV